MEHRIGKYGGFFYCKTHGTISDKGAAILQRIHSIKEDPLMDAIKRTSVSLGKPMDELEEIIDFFVDNPPENEDEDHWMNVREY